MSIHKIVDTVTGEESLVDYTKKELEEQKKAQAAIDSWLAAEEANKAAKLAVMAKLGLTEEELKAILS